MKRIIIGVLISCSSGFNLIANPVADYAPAAMVAASVAAAGYSWLRTPDVTMPIFDELDVITLIPVEKPIDPTEHVYSSDDAATLLKKEKINFHLDINGKLYHAQSGIPDAIKNYPQVSIYSGGYAHCAILPAHSAARMLKSGNMHGPCIAFRYAPDYSRTRFNFCQEQDTACLDIVYKALLTKNPDAQILLRGASKGGTNVLHFLARKSERAEDVRNIKAAVIDSAPLSVHRIVSKYPLGNICARLVFPNYNSGQKTILDAKSMPNIPLFFGRIPNDSMADADDIGKMVHHVQKVGADHVWLYTACESVPHGRISTLKDYPLILNAFYKKYGLTHNLTPANEASASDGLQEAEVTTPVR